MSKEQLYYVSYSSNWADEMDIEGGQIMTKSIKDKFFKLVKERIEDGGYSVYVGSNESIEYDTFKKFKADFEITEITDEEAETLSKFGFDSHGHFPHDIEDVEDME